MARHRRQPWLLLEEAGNRPETSSSLGFATQRIVVPTKRGDLKSMCGAMLIYSFCSRWAGLCY